MCVADVNGKDAAYLERRRKNNEAAKRSRDNRRNKEDELAIWATYLEQENLILKNTLAQGGICVKCQNMTPKSNWILQKKNSQFRVSCIFFF